MAQGFVLGAGVVGFKVVGVGVRRKAFQIFGWKKIAEVVVCGWEFLYFLDSVLMELVWRGRR